VALVGPNGWRFNWAALNRWNDGKSEKAGVGVVEGRCEELKGVRESEALRHADCEEIEANAGSGLAKGDEAESAIAVNSQEGCVARQVKKEGPRGAPKNWQGCLFGSIVRAVPVIGR
jgi:hypothetical protein